MLGSAIKSGGLSLIAIVVMLKISQSVNLPSERVTLIITVSLKASEEFSYLEIKGDFIL